MNKREKEVLHVLLENEKTTLKAIEVIYQEALKAIRELILLYESGLQTENRRNRKKYQEALQEQVEAILEKLHTEEYTTINEYLKDSYTDSYLGTMYNLHGQGFPLLLPIDQALVVKAVQIDSKISGNLYKSLGADVDQLKKVIAQEIARGIATNRTRTQIARNIANQAQIPLKRARTIVATETHRVQEESAQNVREAAKNEGCNIVKQWDAILDGRTRDAHRRLDGQIRGVNELFEMDGMTALYPGGFGIASMDCNCRCIALTRAKWALGAKELKQVKERATAVGLDKVKTFGEFKRKYNEAVNT